MSSPPPALASSPAAAQPLPVPPWRPHRRRRLVLRPPSASRPSSILAHGASARCRSQPQPQLVAAQSHPPPPLPDVGAVRRDAETGLALLLVVLAAVMSCFLSLTILSFAASRTLQKLETAANKLLKVVAEEAHGTLSSLKLSFMEINDLTSQLTNLRKRLTISRFGNEASTKEPHTTPSLLGRCCTSGKTAAAQRRVQLVQPRRTSRLELRHQARCGRAAMAAIHCLTRKSVVSVSTSTASGHANVKSGN